MDDRQGKADEGDYGGRSLHPGHTGSNTSVLSAENGIVIGRAGRRDRRMERVDGALPQDERALPLLEHPCDPRRVFFARQKLDLRDTAAAALATAGCAIEQHRNLRLQAGRSQLIPVVERRLAGDQLCVGESDLRVFDVYGKVLSLGTKRCGNDRSIPVAAVRGARPSRRAARASGAPQADAGALGSRDRGRRAGPLPVDAHRRFTEVAAVATRASERAEDGRPAAVRVRSRADRLVLGADTGDFTAGRVGEAPRTKPARPEARIRRALVVKRVRRKLAPDQRAAFIPHCDVGSADRGDGIDREATVRIRPSDRAAGRLSTAAAELLTKAGPRHREHEVVIDAAIARGSVAPGVEAKVRGGVSHAIDDQVRTGVGLASRLSPPPPIRSRLGRPASTAENEHRQNDYATIRASDHASGLCNNGARASTVSRSHRPSGPRQRDHG